MPTLHRDSKKILETTVGLARQVAEQGSQKALESLAVQHHEPWGHLTPQDRTLRNRLRAHARRLGDPRDSKRGTQSIPRLISECAYEHWHRMLFAKFLAEADLLIEPETKMPVSLQDCEEFAQQQNSDWLSVASSFAQQMLPQIFRPDNPVLSVALPAETRAKLEELLKALPKDVFSSDDSLGWVYQFWQSDKKEETNKAETKIGASDISAVTQLFTEDYMVAFLLDNSIGAWWASKRLSAEDLRSATSEEELRAKVALPAVSFDYLRFATCADGGWQIAGGGFDAWPDSLAGFKLIDPCCGSGHFLVGAFLKLVPLRMHLENLTASEACSQVLSQNIHGLEIDQRCVELAAFALALSAWRYPNAGGYRELPEMQLACSGIPIAASRQEWKDLKDPNLRIGLEWMYDVFQHAPVLGSLIDPRNSDATKVIDWRQLSEALARATRGDSDDDNEAGVAAFGAAQAASLLTQSYDLVLTNVPFLGWSKQGPILQQYTDAKHNEAKADLCTVFLERCLEFAKSNGSVSLVIKQDWLFLKSYKEFRETMLKGVKWNLLARLGEGGFESSAAAGAFTVLLNVSKQAISSLGPLFEDGHEPHFFAVDASKPRKPAQKAVVLQTGNVLHLSQMGQLKNPDCRLVLADIEHGKLLSDYADSYLGLGTCDAPHYFRYWWEIPLDADLWSFIQTPPKATNLNGGRESVVAWNRNTSRVRGLTAAERSQGHNKDYRGNAAWGKQGVSIAMMRSLRTAPYFGDLFNELIAVLIPKKAELLPAITAYCTSPEYVQNVRKIDQKPLVTNATLVKVPFDEQRWIEQARTIYGDGLAKPHSDDPTQWTFHGNPAHGQFPLQVAVAKLLGHKWPAELREDIYVSDEIRVLANSCRKLDQLADEDGIVCLNSLHGEPAAADRLFALLSTAYGDNWSAQKLQELLSDADFKGKSLHEWLRDGFFAGHCNLFHHPFIWHIWDGLLDGFHAFVNYHHLSAPLGGGERTLQKLIYTYLGDWIDRQRSDQRNGVEGADGRVAAAENLKDLLEQILKGEQPYDIFVRWKSLSHQPIGWNPDVNDGIRINIRPFMTAKLNTSKKGSGGIFRVNPRLISWGKDKGKDPQADRPREHYPWTYGWDEKKVDFAGTQSYDGNRWNDLHYTKAFKESARNGMESKTATAEVGV